MLYVFVHGLAVAVQKPGQPLEIALPRVKGHVYKAGNFLAETPIEPGATLTLQGVQAGNADIYKTGFLVNVPLPYRVTPNGRAATVMVPQPTEILGFRCAVDRTNYVARLKAPQPIDFHALADVMVLAYTYANENEVLLDKHYWQPCVTRGAMSLHIIATSEAPESKQHEMDTGQALQQVYENFPGLEYPPPGALRAPWMDVRNPNFGDLKGRFPRGGYIFENNGDFAFALAELEHPASRAQRLDRLGRMHRGNRRIESLWRRPDPLQDSMGGPCGSHSGN
ncbi:MAG TPA: hypothetical protein VGS58_01715 [Candidatus Sulfopaludibacter sp.]|nr:hypothetical protein [Candidatus Sulfopaludibacter sp.]